MKDNFILNTDMYKHTHWKMIPEHIKYTTCYFSSRGVRDKGVARKTLYFGLQYQLIRYLSGVVVTKEMVEQAKEVLTEYFGTSEYFNEEGWNIIVNEYGGHLPLMIRSLPEGSIVPCGNALFTIENTDARFPWLPTFVETTLMRTWYPMTVASTSYGIMELLLKYAKETSDNENIESLVYHLNDFGSRGVSSKESAGVGDMAHLTVFSGSDTIEGGLYAKEYYNATHTLNSVAASEHSETLLFGVDGEKESYAHFMKQFPNGILSIVMDTYDINNAMDNIIGKELKYDVLNRNGKTVFRPDSGYPPHMTIQVLKSLEKSFGATINSKGYKILNPKVGVIYGDFISYGMIMDILEAMKEEGFAIDNVVFGMGGRLLQEVSRDTYQVAIKNSAYFSNYEWIGVSKNPISDPSKKSKAGYFQVILEDGEYKTIQYEQFKQDKDLLQKVFLNGVITKYETFDEIRNRVKKSLTK